MQKAYSNNLWHNHFINEPIFKRFKTAHFMTFKVVKRWHCHIFLLIFRKSGILKTAVSEKLQVGKDQEKAQSEKDSHS